MARIRTIKPEFWQDEKLAPLSALTRLVFLGLISMADDAGRVLDSVRAIDGFIFPLAEDDTCAGSLEELAELGRIERGQTASGQRILQIIGWAKHQRIDKPNLSSALPEIVAPTSPTNPRTRKPLENAPLDPFVETSANHPGNVADASTPRSTIYDLRAGAEQQSSVSYETGDTPKIDTSDKTPESFADLFRDTAEASHPPAPPPPPEKPDSEAVWAENRGLIAGAIRTHAWCGGNAPQVAGRNRKWGMPNELSIARELLKQYDPDELLGGMEHWRRAHSVPDGTQWSLAMCYATGERWRMELAVDAWRNAEIDAINLADFAEVRRAS